MRKQKKKGFNYKPTNPSFKAKGRYKGNKNYTKYQQHKWSLREDIIINSGSLMDEYFSNGGIITKCLDKIA